METLLCSAVGTSRHQCGLAASTVHDRAGRMLQNSKEIQKLRALCFVTFKIYIRLIKQMDPLLRLEKVSNNYSCGRQYICSDTPALDGKQQ